MSYPITPDLGEARVDIELFLAAVQTMTAAATHEDVETAAMRLRSLMENAVAARHRIVEHERNAAYATPASALSGRPSWARLPHGFRR